MLTFELLQKPGRAMQRSRSSTALWHSCREVAEIRLEFAASKAACCGLHQMLTSLIVYIYIAVNMQSKFGSNCSHLRHCRDQAEA